MTESSPVLRPKESPGANYWTSGDSFATSLLLLWLDRVPESVDQETKRIDWDAETIADEIEREWGSEPSGVCLGKLCCAISVISSDRIFDDVRHFIDVANGFAGKRVQPGLFEAAMLPESLWCVYESLCLDRPDDKTQFGVEVRGYIRQLCLREGLITPPRLLGFVGPLNWAFPYPEDGEHRKEAESNARERLEDIESWMKSESDRYVDQISRLPLENGNPKDFAKSLISR